MLEYSKNQFVKLESYLDVAVSTASMRRSFPEYFDEQKPNYEWDEEDNLVAFIQFDSFPEDVFRMFIEAHKLQIKIQRYFNPGDGNKSIPIRDDVVIKENDENEYGWEEEPHRMLWASGLLLEWEDWNIEKNESQTTLIEILKSEADFRIWLRARGDHEIMKKQLVTAILLWFDQNSSNYFTTHHFMCNCPKCRSKYFQDRYAIYDKYILGFFQNFIPKIQCYSSGEMRRLDTLSNLSQPQINVVILHHEEDEKYLKAFHFPKKGWDIEASVWSKVDILPGAESEKLIEQKIIESDVVIALISPSFTSDDHLWRNYLGKVLPRSRKKEILFVPFQIRPCLWREAFQEGNEGHIPNSIILLRPKDKNWPTDENWETATSEIHLIIEKWLKNRLKSDFYFSI